MSTNFNDTVPAAPAGGTNVKWQTDGSGNASAYVPSSAVSGPAVAAPTQAASISATDFVAAVDSLGGAYRLSAYIIITQAASSSSTMPSVVFTWTDADNSTLQTITATTTSAGNTLTTFAQATVVINAKVGFAIQYSTAGYVSSGGTPMQYALHLHVERLG